MQKRLIDIYNSVLQQRKSSILTGREFHRNFTWWLYVRISGGATHKGGGLGFKKLFYSIYIIYI